MTDDLSNPYRFAAAESDREVDPAVGSPFRQPETGRKLSAVDVRTLAFSQRGLWVCAIPLTLWMIGWALAMFAPSEAPKLIAGLPDQLQAVIAAIFAITGGIFAVAWIGGIFFVLAIAMRTHPTWLGFVLWGLAMYPPFLLLMLPYLQTRAAQALNRHGIPANRFGADWKSLPRPGAQPLSPTTTP